MREILVGRTPRPDAHSRPRGVIACSRHIMHAERCIRRGANSSTFPSESSSMRPFTRKRPELAYKEKQLVKQNVFKQTWTSDCKILIRTNDDNVHSVRTEKELIRLKPNP